MIIDARRPSGDVPHDFDVCVVGSGPAGFTAATALAERGLRVGVVEGGGARATLRGQRLLLDRPTGTPYWNLATVRTRMLGGSGNRWGGISRPLDPIDLAARDWVPDSGWPIGWAELEPYYARAADVLELPVDPGTGTGDVPAAGTFETARYRLSPRLRLGDEVAATSPAITVLANVEVTALRLRADSDRIEAVEARTLDGTRHQFTARLFLLAAGGVENARLLLASPGRTGAGIGNEHDAVGRYFMEHVHAPIAELHPGGELADWDSYSIDGWPRLVRSLVPSAQVQRERRLLNASLSVGPLGYVGHPPFAQRDYRVGFVLERTVSALAARHVTVRLPRLRRRVSSVGPVPKLVVYRGEQPPHRENRVVLGDTRDEYGRPRAHLQWTVGTPEVENVGALYALFRDAVAERGWGTLGELLPDWRDNIIGGPHHMGTTRMSGDPATGVVDADCRVHSVENLYVAGSSVFATGGHANPTMTIVALALRLADHLATLPRAR